MRPGSFRWLARAALAIGAVAALLLQLPSCFFLDRISDQPCTVAGDCAPPYVCCSEPRIPSVDTPIPSCQDARYCDAYLPFLLEGQPCNRTPRPTVNNKPPPEQCSAGLVCCPSTLSCGRDGACPDAPTPPEKSSGATCLADPDCPSGEICCNVDFFNRGNGRCSTVSACNPPKTN